MRFNEDYESLCIAFRDRLDELGAPREEIYLMEKFSDFTKELCKIIRNEGNKAIAESECADLVNMCLMYLVSRGYTIGSILDCCYNRLSRNVERLNNGGER